MSVRTWVSVALVATCALAGSVADAATCSVTTSSVVFGVYNVFSIAPVDSTGSVLFNCNGSAKNVQIAITRGQSATFAQRTLTRGAEALGYNFYLDAARTTIWGDGTGGSQAYAAGNPANNKEVVVTIYGRIPAGQDITAGAYSDSVSVTINF